MIRLMVICLVVALALLPGVALADLGGTAQMERDNARCAQLGRRLDRRGLTYAEARFMERQHCVKFAGIWYSDRLYPA